MAKIQEVEQVWHNDGHSIKLRINRAELEVLEVTCPSREKGSGECLNQNNDCIVTKFILNYGLDCNGGVCPAAEDIEICWTVIGDKNNEDSCQVWFMPMTDEIFNAWLISNGTGA